MYIVGHVSPDWDCIGALWLLQRYGGFADADVQFVNTGAPDPTILDGADAVVDTGREWDDARRRFDHHHLIGDAANATCACQQVYYWICANKEDIGYLYPIVALIYAGDTGKPEANSSRQVGIHALLSAKKAKRIPDAELLAYGYELLDALAGHLEQAETARKMLSQHTAYRSDDGLVVALKDAPPGATFAAHEQGARLVLFQSAYPGTNAIGIMRGGEGTDVHAGGLVMATLQTMEYHSAHIHSAIYDELCTWYRHEAGFFAGRGTAKAPDPRPIEVDLADIAALIDQAWKR